MNEHGTGHNRPPIPVIVISSLILVVGIGAIGYRVGEWTLDAFHEDTPCERDAKVIREEEEAGLWGHQPPGSPPFWKVFLETCEIEEGE